MSPALRTTWRRATHVVSLLSPILVAFPAAARGQAPSLQLGARGSTLGVGPELTIGLNRVIALRSSYHQLDLTRSFTSSDADYSLNPNVKGVDAFVDLHPFKGHFRLTGGIVSHTAALNLTGTPRAGTISVDNVDYPTSLAGNVIGKVTLPKQGEYVGFGIGPKVQGTSRFGIAFDVGALHQKIATTTLTATGPLATDQGSAGQAFRSGLDVERAKLQKDIGDQQLLRWMPVVSLTLRVRLKS